MRNLSAMKQICLTFASALFLIGAANAASAECYADYKAKRDDPLRLHYGVIEVPDDLCSDPKKVEKHVERQLKKNDWKLLSVLSVFGEDELNDKKEDAGEFFLRF